MGKALAVAAVVMLAGCATNRYEVVGGAEVKSAVTMPSGEPLVEVHADGRWVWHKTPEQVVEVMAAMMNQQTQLIDAMKKEIDTLAKCPAPGASAPVIPGHQPERAALPHPSMLPAASK